MIADFYIVSDNRAILKQTHLFSFGEPDFISIDFFYMYQATAIFSQQISFFCFVVLSVLIIWVLILN